MPWGEGQASLLGRDKSTWWLAVEVDVSAGVVDLGGKIKFRRGTVLMAGSRADVVDRIINEGGDPTKVAFGTATAGDDGTATAGYKGTATAGRFGTATAGECGTATAGECGTATAGYKGTATAGDDGTLIIKRWDGRRWRFCIAYVGEDGIKAGTPYKLDANGHFIEAQK